jgi:DNA polymerase-1
MAERLTLIDGNSIVYRAFFAIPAGFSTASGLPTNAIYGFASSFRKIFAGKRPERGAVVFDAPGPTRREAAYPQYKAQRPAMPDTLRVQLPWIDRLVAAHGFPILRIEGVEADDVIGTLAKLGLAAGMDVHIVSVDKDFAQLVGERVRMVDTFRDVSYDLELVRKKWGVEPAHIVDLLALVGDPVDNIPGVPGVGPKTAQQLIAAHGSLDEILAHSGELKGRTRELLEQHREQALLSRELARIDVDVALPVDLDALTLAPSPTDQLNALYRELEFYSLLDDSTDSDSTSSAPLALRLVSDLDALTELLAELPAAGDAPLAILPFCDGPSPARGPLVALGLSLAAGTAVLIPIAGVDGLGETALQRLAPWLENEARSKWTHDAKALWVALRRHGVTLRGVRGDTMLESFLIDPNKLIPHRLDQLSKEYLQRALPPAKRLLGSGQQTRTLATIPAAELGEWAGRQVEAVAALREPVRTRLMAAGQHSVLEEIELPLSWLLGQMELDGIAVDADELGRIEHELRTRTVEFECSIHSLAGHSFNIGSTKQLGVVLFEELGLPVTKKTKTGYSTDASVLEKLAPQHPIAAHLLEHRKLTKLINTYTEVLRAAVDSQTGRVHTSFQQTSGVSGRLITTEPDLQRTPVKTAEGRRIREAFAAPPGMQMLSADWSQIELRLLAHVSGDPQLIEAFAAGADVHARTAAQLFAIPVAAVDREQRATGKLVNFSTIYGQGATALSQILGITRKQAQAYIDGYFAHYAAVRAWLDETIAAAHRTGYVTTLLGRRRYVPELTSNSPQDRQAGERIAANTPIQGSAADLCKLAMLAIERELRNAGLAARMVLQIHDELLFEVPNAEVDAVSAIVRQQMTHPYPLRVPLVVEVGVGPSWSAAH